MMYTIIWQVQSDLPGSARKCFHGRGTYSYAEILDGFPAPEVIDLGTELVIWQHCGGVLAAEGWRKVLE